MTATQNQNEPGKLGATRMSWRSGPRHVLRELIRDNPRASEAKILDLFIARVSEDDLILKEIVEYFCTNHYRYLVEAETATPRDIKAEAKKRALERAAQVESAAAALASIMLLNQEMPNGKRRRNCTRPELLRFSAFDKALAKRIPNNNDTLGSVVNEAEAKRILAGIGVAG